MTLRRLAWPILGLISLATVLILGHDGGLRVSELHFGVWSLVPPLAAVLLACLTRQVIPSLAIGVALGGAIAGKPNLVKDFLIPSIGNTDYALILLVYLWCLGGLIGLWTRTGGARHFAEGAAARFVRGPKSAKLFSWFLGMVFHQGGTISTVLTGTTVRPVADRYRVSHEELSYIVDSTASPAATILPFNVWPLYVGGLIVGTVPMIDDIGDAVSFFFRAVPFNFYGLFAVLLTLLFSLELLPFMPGKRWGHLPLVVGRRMSAAIVRARETGQLDRPGSVPMAATELTELKVAKGYRPGLIDFLGPIGVLMGVAIVPFVYGRWIAGLERPSLPIAEAFALALLAGILIALVKGMSLADTIDGVVDGCKGVTIGALILALAVTLKRVADELGTATYIVEVAQGVLLPVLLPALLLLLAMLIAFATGTSWGTYAVVYPVAMPLAWAVHPDSFFLTLCFGAVLGGSTFGDQCSPISDTTILSSIATGSDLMDHVYTQLPLALTAAGLGATLYTILAAGVL